LFVGRGIDRFAWRDVEACTEPFSHCPLTGRLVTRPTRPLPRIIIAIGPPMAMGSLTSSNGVEWRPSEDRSWWNARLVGAPRPALPPDCLPSPGLLRSAVENGGSSHGP
jgi:hypothetical protein